MREFLLKMQPRINAIPIQNNKDLNSELASQVCEHVEGLGVERYFHIDTQWSCELKIVP